MHPVSNHQLTILGLGLAIAGALVYAWSSVVIILANRSYEGPTESQHRTEKMAHLVASVLLLVGFGLQLFATLN